MAITIIVEDGTGVANANSYISEAAARVFAESVGLPLPVDSEACKAALLAAMPYLESQPWQGQRSDPTQALSWPRKLVIINGDELPNNIVPQNIQKAQVQAASMGSTGTDLFPTISGQFVTKEKVGPIETEYSDEYLQTWDGRSIFSAIDVYLTPYLNWVGGYRLSPAFGF